jgi:hypothetical protein
VEEKRVAHTQSDTGTGSAELDVLIIVFGGGCGVWASHTRSYSLDKARRKRSGDS